MKLKNILLATIILLSPAAAMADDTPERLSRDSILTVVHEAEASNPDALNILGAWYYTGQNLDKDYTLAARMWAKAAQLGNVAAIGNLGTCYQYGHGVDRDSVRAMGLYTKSLRLGNPELFTSLREQADRGSAFECAAMGHFYTEGIGCKKDFNEGARYYAVLARRGDVTAMRNAGLGYLNGKNYKEAFSWFKKGTEAGDTSCTYYYGRLLVEGLGTEADPSKGFIYALRAADAGLANAQYLVSQLYRQGKGVSASATEADKWLRTAAYNGLSRAIFDYGKLAAAQDNYLEAAYMFSWLGSRRSFVPQMTALFSENDSTSILKTNFGHYYLALNALNARDFKTFKNELKALEKAKAPIAGVLEAQMLLDPAYEKRDVKKAVKMLTKLAEKNDLYAAYTLGLLYERGIDGLEVNKELALKYLTQAADGKFAYAYSALGNASYEGSLADRSTRQAVIYYAQAYEAGGILADAASRYATCLDDANGAALNPALASRINSMKYPASFTDFAAIGK